MSLLDIFKPSKTLALANDQLAAASARHEATAALFATAGLDLEAMLAAGPDSLKAHLAALTARDEELAAAKASLAEHAVALATARADHEQTAATAQAQAQLLASIGFDSARPAADLPATFAQHVALRATELLAHRGHPPLAAAGPGPDPATTATASTAAFEKYRTMPRGPERDAFFAANAEAIWAGFNELQATGKP
jgi:hypothetical protein